MSYGDNSILANATDWTPGAGFGEPQLRPRGRPPGGPAASRPPGQSVAGAGPFAAAPAGTHITAQTMHRQPVAVVDGGCPPPFGET